MESFQTKLANERVCLFTDNQNVVHIVQYGSRQPALQVEALKIFAVCVSHRIHMEPEWIPRKQNELADYYSHFVDYDDWMLNPAVFRWLNNLWGPYTVYRFANTVNAQSILDSGSLVLMLSTHLHVIGLRTTIGGALQST